MAYLEIMLSSVCGYSGFSVYNLSFLWVDWWGFPGSFGWPVHTAGEEFFMSGRKEEKRW